MAFKIIPCLAAATLAAAPVSAFAWVPYTPLGQSQPNPYYQPYQYQPIPVPNTFIPAPAPYYAPSYRSPNAPLWVMPPNAFGSTIRPGG